jgi:hypothetical protein
MLVIRALRFSLMAIVALACNSDGISGPAGFTHAAASSACGPADGPATAIYLAPDPIVALEPTGVYVRLSIQVPVSNLTGQLWPIGPNTESGAWLHVTDSNTQFADAGYLIVTSVSQDNTVLGSVDVRFPNGQRVRGGFSATWVPRNTTCI